MARDTARKLETSPNAAHVRAVRNASGTVQFTGLSTGTTSTNASGTVTTTVTTVTNLVAFSKAVLVANGGGAGNTGTAKLTANGTTTVASTSSTGTATTTVTNTHTTPLNAPTYKLQIVNNGGTATASLNTHSREQRW